MARASSPRPLTAIQDSIVTLYGLGARATALSIGFNAALTGLLDALENGMLPGASFRRLDSFTFLQDAVAGNLGLVNTVDACVTPGTAPFSCRQPDDYLFWDGVHPTPAGHSLPADYAQTLLAP